MVAAVLLLGGLVGNAFAGDACSSVKFDVDKYTQLTTVDVGSRYWDQSYLNAWQVYFSDGRTDLRMRFSLQGLHQEGIPAGAKVKFLLKDGSVVEAATSADVQATLIGYYSTYTLHLALDKSLLTALSAQPVEGARLAIAGLDQTIDGKFLTAAKLQSTLACLAVTVP